MATGRTRRDRLELAGVAMLVAFAAALQLSIAVAEIFLTLTFVAWGALVLVERERIEVPPMFWPLAAYAGITVLGCAFSLEPRVSFLGCKQLLLYLLVPVVYRLARGGRASLLVFVIITVGGVSAIVGIVEYSILNFDYLGQRPHGTLGHYMTYSGMLMLVIGLVAARLLFERHERVWPALVMPALLVALVLTFTRSAWVGTCVAVGLLLTLKDFRLLAIAPVLAGLFFALAPAQISNRFYSMFDLHDPTSRDRVAMLRAGVEMVEARPLSGVGLNVVQYVYPEFRNTDAVQKRQPHLHNVPMQIAAERGLPALGIWLWFVVSLSVQLARRFRTGGARYLSAAGLAAVAGMLSAGFFEYNFGDSEFLMLFLVLITLPYVADRERPAAQLPLDEATRQTA